MQPEWTYKIERTEYTDMIFGRIGRLLYVGTLFESYCKVIYYKIHLSNNPDLLSNSGDFEKFLLDLEKTNLYNSINKTFKSPESKGVKEILHAARLARNEVAHDLTTSLHHVFVKTDEEEELEKKIASLSFSIVRGELLCIDILTIFFKEEHYKLDIQERIDWIIQE